MPRGKSTASPLLAATDKYRRAEEQLVACKRRGRAASPQHVRFSASALSQHQSPRSPRRGWRILALAGSVRLRDVRQADRKILRG